MKLKVKAGGQTDVGMKREYNQDQVLVDPELGIFAVADGMGGHAAGEVASKAAIEALRDFVRKTQDDKSFTWPFGARPELSPNENILVSAVKLANREVCAMAEKNQEYLGMGTTLAVVFMPEDEVHIVHVGDSRVYRLREGALEVLTQDHSWVNEQVQRNIISEDEARQHRWRNVITRALGNNDAVEVDLQTVEPQPGDIYLVCSDGLTGMVDDMKIAEVLGEMAGDPEAACRELVRLSNEAGGQDNISVVVVRLDA